MALFVDAIGQGDVKGLIPSGVEPALLDGKFDEVGCAHEVGMLGIVKRDLVNVAGVGHADVIGP